MSFSNFCKQIKTYISKHSSDILTGLGIAGSIVSIGLAVGATPKAIKKIETEKETKEVESLTIVDTVKSCWKYYIPATLTEIASIACLISARKISAKRETALAAAYSLSETALRTYKEKVVETLGEKKEEKIRNEIAKDQVEETPKSSSTVIIASKGSTLCFDSISKRYFKSDIEKIRKSINWINVQLRSEMYISLNDFYEEIGLEPIKIGDDLGWNIDNGFIDVEFSSALTDDDELCLVLDYNLIPKHGYDKIV